MHVLQYMHMVVLTHCQRHDAKLIPDQPDHLALLQRRGPAADDRLASTAQLQEVALQLLLKGPVQRLAVYNQNKASHAAQGGFPISPRCSPFSHTVLTLQHFQFKLLEKSCTGILVDKKSMSTVMCSYCTFTLLHSSQ